MEPEQAHNLLEEISHQPIQYWAALLVIGSLIASYISVRRMVNTLREQNKELMEMLRERDEQRQELNNKLMALLEEQRRRRGGQ